MEGGLEGGTKEGTGGRSPRVQMSPRVIWSSHTSIGSTNTQYMVQSGPAEENTTNSFYLIDIMEPLEPARKLELKLLRKLSKLEL